MTKPGRLSTIEVRPLGDALELYEMVGDPAEFDVVWKGLLKYRDGLERVRQSGGDPKGIEWVTTLAANFSPVAKVRSPGRAVLDETGVRNVAEFLGSAAERLGASGNAGLLHAMDLSSIRNQIGADLVELGLPPLGQEAGFGTQPVAATVSA
jgi:hypothetical protein